MKVYLYEIKLLDPLFYSREGLSAAFTVPYLHATSVNLAVKSAINLDPAEQPLLISDENGGRNTPRYSNSLVSEDFYFTPARLATPLKYFPEVTKGENDGYIFRTGMGELFQAGTLNYIPPESIFRGYLIEIKRYKWPNIIRLGSFRGKVFLSLKELEIINSVKEPATVNHPVDPLVSSIQRGIIINIFPYPLIENAKTSYAIIAKEIKDSHHVIAFPEKWQLPEIKFVKGGKKAIMI